MATDLIGVRDSTASPGTMEYYNKSTNVGFSTPQELSNFYNTLYGGNTTAENVFQAIPVSSLQSEQAITVPTQTPQADALAPAAASAKETSKSLEQYIAELTPPQTETSKQYDALSAQISELLPSLTGRGQEQLKAEEQSGLPQMKTQLAQINSQLLQKVAEATKLDASYEQLIANLENPANAQQQGIPMSAIIGQQAQVRKMQLAERNAKAADIGLLQAYALGLQGQVQAAQAAVDRAIDLKYQDRESTLNLKMQQLSLLEGRLNKEEQIAKQALERKYNEEQQRIAEEKAKAKDNINLAFSANVQTQFANKNGEFFRVSDGKAYGSPEEFFKDAGIKSFEEAYRRGLVTDINAGRLADIEAIQQLRTQYPDAGISISDTPLDAANKIKANSAIYRRETYIAPTSGGGGGGAGGGTTSLSSEEQQIRDILERNASTGIEGGKGWGTAAAEIEQLLGRKIEAGSEYDNILRQHYAYGKSLDELFPDPGKELNSVINTVLASGRFTNQQRADVVSYIQQAGLPGAQEWWANNKFGQAEKEAYRLYQTSTQILGGALSQLENMSASSIGPYKALVESKKPYLLMQQDPQYTQLYQTIETAQAQVRKGFYGTAVTGTEQGNAQRFLINPEDSYTTLVTKINGLMGVMAFVNDANTLRPFGIKVDFNDYVNPYSPPAVDQSQDVKYLLEEGYDWETALRAVQG